MHFDFSIRLGDIMQVVAFVGMAAFAFASIRGTLNLHSLRLTNIEKVMGETSGLVTNLAVQNNRLENIEHDIQDLRRGKGFITSGPDSINRQY